MDEPHKERMNKKNTVQVLSAYSKVVILVCESLACCGLTVVLNLEA